MRVRCIDNSLYKELLTVGLEYTVLSIDERYDNYRLDGLEGKLFHARRFETISGPRNSGGAIDSQKLRLPKVEDGRVEDAQFHPIARYRGKANG